MQNETHYTKQRTGRNIWFVVRRTGDVRVATITKADLGGWAVDLYTDTAGTRQQFDRQQDAFITAVNHDNNTAK